MRGIQPIPRTAAPERVWVRANRTGTVCGSLNPQRRTSGKLNVNGLIYSIFYSFVNHVQTLFCTQENNQGMGTELPYLLIDDMSGTGEENSMWTWNHRRPVVLVAFVLMIVVSAQTGVPG